uniref:Uncharacterized protein n=1 Tax=Arundo donax TaxID=35708 RepID=A0A0A9H6B1_ARUDO
MILSVSSSLF